MTAPAPAPDPAAAPVPTDPAAGPVPAPAAPPGHRGGGRNGVTPGGKTGRQAGPSVTTPGRPYATNSAELNRPYIPGETPAEQRNAAQGWRWIIRAVLGLVSHAGLYAGLAGGPPAAVQPSSVRDHLLPPSTQPVYVIAGVGVGWFWILFIAAPAVAAVTAALWWAMLAWSNHRARSGHLGHVRPGQQWPGEQYPTGPLVLVAAAAVLAAAGALLRWAGPAAATLPGRLLLVAVLAAAGWGFVQFARWAHARGNDHPPDQQGHLPGVAVAGMARSARRSRAGGAVLLPAPRGGFPESGQAALRAASPVHR